MAKRPFIYATLILFLLMILSIPLTAAEADSAKEPLTLYGAIEIAMENNLGMQRSREQLLISESAYRLNKAFFRPDVTLSGELARDEDSDKDVYLSFDVSQEVLGGGGISLDARTDWSDISDEDYNSELRLGFTQPLLSGFGGSSASQTLKGRRLLDSEIQIDRRLQSVKRSLVLSVSSSFYGVLRAKQAIRIAEAALKEADMLLKAATTKKREGLVAKIEVSRAKVQCAQARARLVSARRNLEILMDNFVELLGLESKTELVLDEIIEYIPSSLNTENYISYALANRDDYRDAHLSVGESKIATNIARRRLLPEVNIGFDYGAEGEGSSFEDSWELGDTEWRVLLTFSVPIWEIQRREDYIQAVSRYRINRNQLEETERTIASDVREAISHVKGNEENLAILEDNVKQAKETLRLANLSYEEGLVTNLDVVNAQDTVIGAENDYVAALTQYRVALIRLHLLLGKAWEFLVQEGIIK